jgi:glycogen operon protein
MLLDGRAQTTGIRQRGNEATLLIVINGHHETLEFMLPEAAGAVGWSLLLDTNVPDFEKAEPLAVGASYTTMARSVALFVLHAEEVTTEPKIQ